MCRDERWGYSMLVGTFVARTQKTKPTRNRHTIERYFAHACALVPVRAIVVSHAKSQYSRVLHVLWVFIYFFFGAPIHQRYEHSFKKKLLTRNPERIGGWLVGDIEDVDGGTMHTVFTMSYRVPFLCSINKLPLPPSSTFHPTQKRKAAQELE